MVVLAQLFVDESYRDEPPGIMAFGGYIYLADKAKKLSKKWGNVLEREGLEYFRMSECAHGNKQFENKCKEQRIKIETEMISFAKRYSEYGFAVLLSQDAYNALMPPDLLQIVGSPYVYGVRECLNMTRRWAERAKFSGQIAYNFEAGHVDDGKALAVLDESFKSERVSDHFRHAAHAFIDKKSSYPLQSGDMLAWHALQHFHRSADGRAPRKDFVALAREHDTQVIITNDHVRKLVSFLREKGYENSFAAPSGGQSS